jgi:hypothetical protein
VGCSLAGCSVAMSLCRGTCQPTLAVGTNETRIIAMDARDLYRWKTTRHLCTFGRSSVPLQALEFLFVANLFSAFIAGRQPKAVSVVSGTG